MSQALSRPVSWRAGVYLTREHGGGRLTPRQRRRIEHKRNHAAAPFGGKA